MTQEKWKTITTYNGYDFGGKYEVSSWGNIRNKKTQQKLAFYTNRIHNSRNGHKDGYLRASLQDTTKKRRHVKVNRLVAFYFLEVPADADTLEVNHIDGNTQNNSYTNLEFITHAENIRLAAEARQAARMEAAK